MQEKLSIALVVFAAAAAGCSSSTAVSGTDAAADAPSKDAHTTTDAGKHDAQQADVGTKAETGATDSGHDAGSVDSGEDTGTTVDAHSDATADGGYPTCVASWLVEPTLPMIDGGAALGLPADAGSLQVILHGQVKSVDAGGGGGTQNYKCTANEDAGTYAWVLTGPEAKLDDCNGTFLIEHTASDAGATRPQWASQIDTSIVVGKKLDAVTVSATAVPWLLLQEVSTSGTGLLTKVLYVQRVNTTGGVPAASTCTAANVNGTVDVPYTADYYFYGP